MCLRFWVSSHIRFIANEPGPASLARGYGNIIDGHAITRS